MAQIIDKHTIENIIQQAHFTDLLNYIEQSFIQYSNGQAVVPPVGTLSFDSPPGDVHIKYGYIKGEAHYVIKIASGFYDNPALGISSSNGLNLVFNQKNGLLATILLDQGYLTDVRTALAGAVVAKYLAPPEINAIGILGTGIQARLQLKYLKEITDCRNVLVWGRDQEKCAQYIEDMTNEGFNVKEAETTSEIGESCELIVTTTPATSALLMAEDIKKEALITAMGADTLGKQELDIDILVNASLIAIDSTSQCKAHGEIHKAIKTNHLKDESLLEIGNIISDKDFIRPSGIIVADLTGIATQDMMISKFVLDHLNASPND